MPEPHESPLVERTLQLYRNAPRHIKLTHMASATGISMSWISRFGNGKMPNPGVRNVQTLHDYLQGIEAQ